MNSDPLVSVIIPVYNPGKYLYHCLDSITGQTYQNLEIILVDDGSTDDSLSVCREYAAADHRITVFHQENAGVSAARNRGMEAAHGDFYSFIDSDDFLETDTYEYLLKIWEKEQTDVVCFEYYNSFPNREDVHCFRNKSRYGRMDRRQAMREQVSGVPFCCVKLFSRKVVENLRFTVGLARGEDGQFACRAIHKASSVFYCDRPLLHYVQSEESAVRGVFRRSQLSCLNSSEKEDPMWQDYPELTSLRHINFMHLCISLYCDMYADAADWRKEQKYAHKRFCETKKKTDMSGKCFKVKVKFAFFRVAPQLFAAVHKFRNQK